MTPQFNKGTLEMCVLALLSKRDFYGFELVDSISQYIDISEGTIYPLLRRLMQEAYVEAYLQTSPTGPSRKYYRMTEHGRQFTKTLIQDWQDFSKKVNQLIQTEVVHE
jgi:PadR family transcriptional regulator PadR